MCGGLPGGCRELTASCFIIATGCMHPALCMEHKEPWKGFSRVSLTPPDFHPWQFGPSDSHLFAGCDFTLTWSFLHSFYHVTLPCSICHEPITRHKPRVFPTWKFHTGRGNRRTLPPTDLSVTTRWREYNKIIKVAVNAEKTRKEHFPFQCEGLGNPKILLP